MDAGKRGDVDTQREGEGEGRASVRAKDYLEAHTWRRLVEVEGEWARLARAVQEHGK